jgi:2-keto-4-pentenoate hydratase/2-oxohepta-3-ene-1,7-dioic acid hydratase in catechol pathway
MEPSVFLKPGDEVVCENERIGTLKMLLNNKENWRV